MDLPQFDQPQQPETSAPSRKPRRKKRLPVKAKTLRPPKAVPKRRRKKRKATPVKAEHAGGRFTPEVYRLIGELMALGPASRSLVLGIVQGLTK
jgi:hypothetical protein